MRKTPKLESLLLERKVVAENLLGENQGQTTFVRLLLNAGAVQTVKTVKE